MEAYLKFANSEPLVTAEDEATAIDTAREEFEAIGMRDGMPDDMLGELLSGIEAYEVLNSEGTVIGWKICSL